MRKVSKSRAEDADDVVSSTNGSVVNDSADSNKLIDDDEEENKQDSDYNDDEDGPLNPKKSKSRGKGRPKKKSKKAEKVTGSVNDNADTNKLTDDEEDKQDSDYNDDEDDDKKSKTKGKGRSKKKFKKAEKAADESEPEEEYEVEKIMDAKKIKGRLHYLIRWKGYSADTDSWEPENTLSCPELINKFNEEKENSKNKEDGKPKKEKKRPSSSKNDSKSPVKRTKTEWDSEKADENAEYEVERILEVHHKKNGKREFLIHWKGWSSKFDSWEPESNLNCPDLINKFMDKVSAAKTSDTRNLRVAREATNRFTLQDPSSGRRLSKRRGQRQRVRYDDAE